MYISGTASFIVHGVLCIPLLTAMEIQSLSPAVMAQAVQVIVCCKGGGIM